MDNAQTDSEHWSQIFGTEVDETGSECLNAELLKGRKMMETSTPRLIWDFDWDVCFVLDACRYDAFEHCNKMPGKLHKILSPGFETKGWVEATFAEAHKDTILVTANPWFTKTYPDIHLRVGWLIEPWRTDWNKALGTVLPESVTQVALEQYPAFPGKRWVIFYMQPHDPFIADDNLNVTGNRIAWGEDWHSSGREFRYMLHNYYNNLRLVLQEVQRCSNALPGKHVITSDHGESFGECGVCWTHRGGFFPWLIEIPWFEVEK